MTRVLLALALAFGAASASWPASAAFDGQWAGKIVSDYGPSCENDLEISVIIRNGDFTGHVVGGGSRFAVSGKIEQDGRLDGLASEGGFIFNLQGQAAGVDEIEGYWTAREHDTGVCAGSFKLARASTTTEGTQAVGKRSPQPAPPEPQSAAQKITTKAAQAPSTTARKTVSPKASSASKSGVISEDNEFFVQFASFKAEVAAKRQLVDFQSAYPGLSRDAQLSIRSADLGERGTFYRLIAGPFSKWATAQKLCRQLKARNQGCLLLRQSAKRESSTGIGAADTTANDQPTETPEIAHAEDPKTRTAQRSEIQSHPNLSVLDFVFANGVADREPVAITKEFSAAQDRAYAFARIRNSGPPTRLSFAWHLGDTEISRGEVQVGSSSSWRTWGSISLRPGDWRVQLVTPDDGLVIAENTFTVK